MIRKMLRRLLPAPVTRRFTLTYLDADYTRGMPVRGDQLITITFEPPKGGTTDDSFCIQMEVEGDCRVKALYLAGPRSWGAGYFLAEEEGA